MSVTDIENWLRDPYTIYAKHVLRLFPLEAIDTPPGAADRGTFIHEAIGEFTKTFADALPADVARELVALGKKHFAPLKDYEEARAFWWTRFLRIAGWFEGWERERRAGATRIFAELSGKHSIPLGKAEFLLTARADRIERRADGSYAILDYKTGQPPTEPQVRSGLAPQLTLEAAILRNGGFPGIAAGSVSEIGYVRLKGGDPPGEPKTIKFTDGTPDSCADIALQKLTGIAQRFLVDGEPYRSLVHPMWKKHYGDYDHLARVKEWAASGGESEDRLVSLARQIPDAAKARQIAAADPERSVFVSANAGSGKTHVLVQRVINLLLRGEDPAKILCITFTKAAAANMATRVFDTLAEWTALDDDALDEKIRLATGKAPDAAQRAIARRLFANALETPGGLKVQTIHAFCTRLLHQFPFEADVAARFEVLDEAATAQLLNELTLEVLLEGATKPDGALGKALAAAITAAADITFKEVIAETIGKRDLITEWTGRAGGVQQAIDELTRTFGLAPGDSFTAVEDEYFSASLIPAERMAGVDRRSFLPVPRPTRSVPIHCRAPLRSAGRERLENYLDVFCTGERTRPRQCPDQEACRCQSAMGGASQRRKGARMPFARTRIRLARARSQRGADHGRRRGDRPLSRGKGPPRPARLRGSDRQDAHAASRRLHQEHRGRLGALQARSRHQPRACR